MRALLAFALLAAACAPRPHATLPADPHASERAALKQHEAIERAAFERYLACARELRACDAEERAWLVEWREHLRLLCEQLGVPQ